MGTGARWVLKQDNTGQKVKNTNNIHTRMHESMLRYNDDMSYLVRPRFLIVDPTKCVVEVLSGTVVQHTAIKKIL